jgi:hypothetical protein
LGAGDDDDYTPESDPCGCSDDTEGSYEDAGTLIPCGPQCSGLSDDGTLDASIAALLLEAHGS